MKPVSARGHVGVAVVCSPRSRVHDSCTLQLPVGSTLIDAVHASGLFERHPELRGLADAGALHTGVWGVRRGLDTVLADGDRVELYRALQVDPKESRRLRYRAQGERGRKPRAKAIAAAAAGRNRPT